MERWDRRYLLSIEELLGQSSEMSGLEQRCLGQLDQVSRERAEAAKNRHRRAEIIGAGLILQLALREARVDATGERPQEARADATGGGPREARVDATGERPQEAQVDAMGGEPREARVDEAGRISREASGIFSMTAAELLHTLEQTASSPLPMDIGYGGQGKPYFKNYPYHYNISHSGKYVLCVLANCPVGVDIQEREVTNPEHLVKRFFSEEAKRLWKEGAAEGECSAGEIFFRIWCRKEAYAKLTGEGLGAVLDQKREEADCLFEEYELEDYQIAICWHGQK